MKVVLQRAKNASVCVDEKVIGRIDYGYVALVGFTTTDSHELVKKMADKIIHLRVFTDDQDKMNLSLLDVGGQILSISQFTLYANARKGRRPSFIEAARPKIANELYEYFNQCLLESGIEVETGQFQADMKVSLTNDGPVTIILDSKELFDE